MQFNSLEFVFFCVLFYSLWPWLRGENNRRWAFISVASFVFYGWWDWRFVVLLIGSGLLDFYSAAAMVRWPRTRKFWLVLSLAGNLGSLAIFKYLDFLTVNANYVLSLLGGDTQLPLANLLLPVGISFYTFQSMSYTIDVYRGHLKPAENVLHFFAYLSMFPQLVAGPIMRASDLLPQLMTTGQASEAMRWRGTQLIAAGLFKKMVIADTVALAVNQAFDPEISNGGCVFWWVAVMAFAVQIHCDFSGYSDIARGLSNWMGYEFPVNFDHPYVACGLREFWGRWHISLSTWFRDYVYIPLGGSHRGVVRGHVNLWITMIASGIWHGANWTFIAWGGLHALFLSVERISRWPERMSRLPGGRIAATVTTFVLVLLSWVFFRAESLIQAVNIAFTMFNVSSFALSDLSLLNRRAVCLTVLFLLSEMRFLIDLKWPDWTSEWIRLRLQPAWTALILVSCVYLRGPGNTFIYFRF